MTNQSSPVDSFFYSAGGVTEPQQHSTTTVKSTIKSHIPSHTSLQPNKPNCENSMMALSLNNTHPQQLTTTNRTHDINDNQSYAASSQQFRSADNTGGNHLYRKTNIAPSSHHVQDNIEASNSIYSMYHNIANFAPTNNNGWYGNNDDRSIYQNNPPQLPLINSNNNINGPKNELVIPNFGTNPQQHSLPLHEVKLPVSQQVNHHQPPNFNIMPSQLYEPLSTIPFNGYHSTNMYAYNHDPYTNNGQHIENDRSCMYYAPPPPPYIIRDMGDNFQYMVPPFDNNSRSDNMPILPIDQSYYQEEKQFVDCGRSNVQQPFFNDGKGTRSNPVLFKNISHYKLPSSISNHPMIGTNASHYLHNNNFYSDDDDIRSLHGSNKNTQEGTRTAIRRFQRWYQSKYQEVLAMDEVDKHKAPKMLEAFFNEIRDTRPGKVGKEYEQVTLTTYKNGLRRYFLTRKCPPGVDNFDIAGPEFESINQSINNKQNLLKCTQKVTKWSLIDSIDNFAILKMCEAGIIGNRNPLQLVRIMWLINTKCFSIKGRLAHHRVQLSDFQLLSNSNGSVSVKYSPSLPMDDYDSLHYPNTPSSNYSTHSQKSRKNKSPVILSPTDATNTLFINCFQLYFEKRPRGFQPFYLTPKSSVMNGDIWFNKVAMGKNSIGRIMNDILARKVAR